MNTPTRTLISGGLLSCLGAAADLAAQPDLGPANLTALRQRARYIRVSPAGQREAAPHDVIEIKAHKARV